MALDLADRIKNLVGLQGTNREERDLINAPIEKYNFHGTANPGSNQTYRVELRGGLIAFHKPFAGVNFTLANAYGQSQDTPPINECAAWRLALAMGSPFAELVPSCVFRDVNGQGGSLSAQAIGVVHTDEPLTDAPDQAMAAAFFDSLIGQQDRHSANYRWDRRSKRLRLIDHGFAFARTGDYLNAAFFLTWRWSTGNSQLTRVELDALTALLASKDRHTIALVIEADRVTALESRAAAMLATRTLLSPAHF